MKSISLLLALYLFQPAALAYIWPNPPIDGLEDAYTISSGFGALGIVDDVTPCTLGPAGSGRQTSAEWLRTAYHDMATYDSATGLGGLDASIGFETNRPENIGTAFNTTMSFFNVIQTNHMSFSDILAVGVILAIKNCGGPSIPFRPGCIDATEAGPSGVPQPTESLETHIHQ